MPTQPKRIGDYLLDLGLVTKDQLDKAFEAQKSGQYPDKRMGDILIVWNIITRAQLDQAIELQMLDMHEG
jgi:hypothetical protein